MASLNKVMIIGNLGTDPEMRFTPSGSPVTTFSVACNNKYTKNGESKEETEWFNVVAWNKQAETCNKFLSKGSQVYVEGKQHTRTWDGQDGQKHYKTELIASQVLFMGNKRAEPEEQELEPQDIPF